MDVFGWRTALPVIGVDGGGYQVPVVVGLVNVVNQPEIAMCFGEQSAVVLLGPKAAAELVVNLDAAEAQTRKVQGTIPFGHAVAVVTDLTDADDGQQVTLRMIEAGAVVLDDTARQQLISNLRRVMTERFAEGGELE